MARGKVRCGYCQTIFNALDSLEDEWHEAPPEPSDLSTTTKTPIQEPANPEFESIRNDTDTINEPDTPQADQEPFPAGESDNFIVEELPDTSVQSEMDELHLFSTEPSEYPEPEEIQGTAVETDQISGTEDVAETDELHLFSTELPEYPEPEEIQGTAVETDQISGTEGVTEADELHLFSTEPPEYPEPEEIQGTTVEADQVRGTGDVTETDEPYMFSTEPSEFPEPEEIPGQSTEEPGEDEEPLPLIEIEDLTPDDATAWIPDHSPAPAGQAEEKSAEPPAAEKHQETQPEPVSEGYLKLAPASTAEFSGMYPEQDIPLALREELQQALEPGRGKKVFFRLLGILVLISVLAAQALYFYRTPLSQHTELRPVIATLCKMLRCDLPLRNDIGEGLQTLGMIRRSISIDPEHADRLRIQATIFNKAEYAQVFPIVEVSLLNEVGKVLAMRRFMPKDYIQDATQISKGIGAKSIHEINIEVVKPSVPVIAYQFDFR